MADRTGKRGVIEFVVGSEKKIRDLLPDSEVLPLLKCAVGSGASSAAVKSSGGEVLWTWGAVVYGSCLSEELPIRLEGEDVGSVELRYRIEDEHRMRGFLELLRETLNALAYANLRRILTTETHTNVVNSSYEDLLSTNRMLAASEARYRELAGDLEKKVLERTDDLKRTYGRLLQREKMASVGQLAAGVAHEINNPLGFIVSNLHTLGKYVARYREMLEYYRAWSEGCAAKEPPDRKWQKLRLDFIIGDSEELIGQCLSGSERVRKIVSDLKGFSHIEDAGETPVKLHDEIDRTLNVLAHEIPKDAEIIRDYRPVTTFLCNPALLCQVFLNIVLNALEARPAGLKLTITTEQSGEGLRIIFSDNGPGVPDGIIGRIFEPFFTTKDVGRGTGMGLTVAYDVITGYGGTIEVKNGPKEGAAFIIELPAKEGERV